ncbi:hypothetical protein [Peribacillus sp. SCS-155]|uniref:hypothetical protein n=1 Tax=Peribacillus sedimenti TaxID=3115297 RepID=UPI003905AA19
MVKNIAVGMATGLLSGLILGFLLKLFESISGIRVYALLLNVDFLPAIGLTEWSEAWEFSFHLVTSLAIGVAYTVLTSAWMIQKASGQFIVSFLLVLPASLLYFPLSFWAVEMLTSPSDLRGFGLWTAGHIVYAFCLPIFSRPFLTRERKHR